jgi:hypothetical protein
MESGAEVIKVPQQYRQESQTAEERKSQPSVAENRRLIILS